MSEPTLPSQREIALALPRWGRVAFAARCARRAAYFYPASPPGTPAAGAAEAAERAAATGTHLPYRMLATDHGLSAGYFLAPDDPSSQPPAHLVAAARAAATASLDGAPFEVHPAMTLAVRAVADIVAGRAAAGTSYPPEPTFVSPWVQTFVREDFTRLAAAAARDVWDDNTPVGPERFGEMWADEALVGWWILAAGARRLAESTRNIPGGAELTWSTAYDREGVPKGVAARVRGFDLTVEKSREFAWHELANTHSVAGGLFGLWSEVIGGRVRQVREAFAAEALAEGGE